MGGPLAISLPLYDCCHFCPGNAIQAFGNGTDVKLHPDPPVHTTTSSSSVHSKTKNKESNYIDTMHITNEIPTHNGLPGCANLIQVSQNLCAKCSVQSPYRVEQNTAVCMFSDVVNQCFWPEASVLLVVSKKSKMLQV